MFTGLALYVRGLMSNRVLCRASLATVPHTGGRQHSYTLPYSKIQNSIPFQDRELNRKIDTDRRKQLLLYVLCSDKAESVSAAGLSPIGI